MNDPNDFPLEHTAECFASHMGFWSIEPRYLSSAWSAIRAGVAPQSMDSATIPKPRSAGKIYRVESGVAFIPMSGPMMKGFSKFGGVSTVFARRQIRAAARDEQVKSILLLVDSPGGHTAGTHELALDIAAANERKPVVAQVEDLAASAAYHAIAGARQIYANGPALIGSIGTFVEIEDTSKAAEMAGVKMHLLATGEYKGQPADGLEVPENVLDHYQSVVDELFAFFRSHVMKQRALSESAFEAAGDGRIFIAAEAESLGLVDGVQSLDETLSGLVAEGGAKGQRGSLSLANAELAVEKELGG